jgi:glycosyltransferase involved in cell wall biosynthesis
MTRVLHVFEPPDGGVAEAVALLALGLGEHGVASEVAGPREGRVPTDLAAAGVPVHRLAYDRGYGRPWRDARALRELTSLLRGGRFDLVHAHAAKAGLIGRLAARAAKVPAVYSPHCLPFVGEVSRARDLGSTAVERVAGPLTAGLLCVCEQERAVALDRRLVDPPRTHVVHNGAAACARSTEPDPRLTALRGDDGVVAGAVAVLREQKGLGDLLRAAPAILAADPRARVAIVGSGPLDDELRSQAAALGLDREQRFAFLPYEGPSARHLLGLDVYVLPSRWEAFPIGVLEALACGVPQVATDVGGVAEAITPATGVLVPPADPAVLARAVTEVLGDDPRRVAMAKASVARHAERFTVEAMVAGTARVYRDVLTGAASTGGARRATP